MGEYIEPAQAELTTENLIEKELQPQIEIDQGGFKRKVFHRGEHTFSFKGREEMPVYDAATTSHTHLVGKLPRHVAPAELEAYSAQFDTQKVSSDAKDHYIVNKSLLGVVDLAVTLGAQDPSLLDLQKELQEGNYSERALSLIDELIACNAVDDHGELLEKPNTNAEALVLLSLLGDVSAKNILQKRVNKFAEQEEKIKTALKQEGRENTAEPFDPKELACVHATRYMPERSAAGQYQIKTTSDATDNASFRNTIHFTLNHKVGAHSGGSWSDAGVVLISPFEKLMEQNGKPAVLNLVDTYWAQNPGTPITLPEETLLVLSGNKDIKGLYERKGSQIFVKSEGFTKSDIHLLVASQERENDEDKIEFFAKRIFDMCRGVFKNFDDAVDYVKTILGEDIEDVVFPQDVQNALSSVANEEAVKYGIREAGFENFSGALEERMTRRADKLGEFLGVETLAHSGTLHRTLETTIYDRVAQASQDFFSGESHPFDWKKLSLRPNGSAFSQLDPPTRRSLYESGYLTTREV